MLKDEKMFIEMINLLVTRSVSEASKNIASKRRTILNACLKCLATMMEFKPFVEKFQQYIDGQLSSIYQLLESRIIHDYDDDILRIASNFAKNCTGPMENLLRCVADLSSFYDELIYHSVDVLKLLNIVLTKCSPIMNLSSQINEGNDANSQIAKYTDEIILLGEKMVVASSKTVNDGNGLDQEAINMGCLACQLVIQVNF